MMTCKVNFGVLALSWLLPLAVAAAEIEASSTIDRVRLYADRAEITRLVTYESAAGSHQIMIAGLPDQLLQESLQVVPVTADAGTELGQVALITRPLAGQSDAQAQALLDQIAELERLVTGEYDRIAAEEAALALIKSMAEAVQDEQATRTRQGQLDASQLRELVMLVRDESQRALGEITQARVQIDELRKRIELLQRRLDEIDQGAKAERVVAIDLEAERAAQGTLELVYQVPGGRWRSLIDARLDSDSGAVMLTQYALVNQRTGEDWENVRLELSTTRPFEGRLPDLEPWVIDVFDKSEYDQRLMSQQLTPMLARTRSLAAEAEASLADVQPEAEIEGRGLETRFVAARRVTVPNGSSEHQVLIARLDQSATIHRKIIPDFKTEAVLTANFDFAGPTSVPDVEFRLFRDGGYVGASTSPMLVPGGQTELQFGRDDRIEVTHRLARDGRASEGIITDYNRFTRNFETLVTNRHDQPISVTVLNRHPVSRDERVEVELTDSTTEPSRLDVEGRDGVVAWDMELEADTTQTIRFGYSIIHPADLGISNF